MPNASDFTYYCSKLGIDHMEVIPNEQYGSDEILGTYDEILKMDRINIRTYDEYKYSLKNENIVFFIAGKVPELTTNFKGKFIGQIIREIETRIEPGTGAYGQYYGSEGVKQFLTDLINGELDLKEDETGSILLPVSENTLYVGNAFVYQQGSGADASPPEWTKVSVESINLEIDCGLRTFNEANNDEIVAQGLLGIKANDFEEFLTKLQQKVMSAKGDNSTLNNIALPWLYTKFGLYPNIAGDYTSKQARNYGLLKAGVSGVNEGLATIEQPIGYSPLNRTIFSDIWELKLYSYSDKFVYRLKFMEYDQGNLEKTNFGIQTSWSLEDYLGRNGQSNYRRAWRQSSQYSGIYEGVVSAGGFDLSKDYVSLNDTSKREQKYNAQPFIIGIVFWITEVINDVNPYARVWAIPVAFDEFGELMTPYVEGNRQEGASTQDRYQFNINFNGHIALRLALPMSNQEIAYALSEKNLIVPVNCLPSDNNSLVV